MTKGTMMPEETVLETGTEAPPEGAPAGNTAAPEGTSTEVDEWADPDPLEDGVDAFPRDYVEKLRDREAKYRIRARDLNKQVDEFGGMDFVSNAVKTAQGLQTEDGVISMFIETGRALGLGLKELEALFGEAQAQATQETEQGPNDDDVLTWGEAKKLLQEQVFEPQKAEREAQQKQAAQQATDSTLESLGYKPGDEEVEHVLRFAAKHLKDDDWNPEHIRAAVRRGHEDFNAFVEKRAEAKLRAKLETKELVPSSTGNGSSPGGTALPEPQNMDEAKARARAKLRDLGEW